MAVDYHPHPERFLGTGSVFIAWTSAEVDPAGPYYWGYWDSFPELLPSIPLEEAPQTRSISEAVEWGRQRTVRVLIRPETDPDEFYWAGVGEPRDGDVALKRLSL